MKAVILTLLSCFILSLTACEKITVPPEPEEPQEEQKQSEDNGQQNGNENTQTMTMEITAGGKTITATLADNATAKALAEKLKSGSVTVEMRARGIYHFCFGLSADKMQTDCSVQEKMRIFTKNE